MRTTLNIEDEALDVIRTYADERELSLGQAASDLVFRGFQSLPRFDTKNGRVIFDLPPGTPPLTNDVIRGWEEAEHEEEYHRAFSPRR